MVKEDKKGEKKKKKRLFFFFFFFFFSKGCEARVECGRMAGKMIEAKRRAWVADYKYRQIHEERGGEEGEGEA